MRYHLFQKFFGKMVKIKEMSFLSTREDTNFLPPLYLDLSFGLSFWPEKKTIFFPGQNQKCPEQKAVHSKQKI